MHPFTTECILQRTRTAADSPFVLCVRCDGGREAARLLSIVENNPVDDIDAVHVFCAVPIDVFRDVAKVKGASAMSREGTLT